MVTEVGVVDRTVVYETSDTAVPEAIALAESVMVPVPTDAILVPTTIPGPPTRRPAVRPVVLDTFLTVGLPSVVVPVKILVGIPGPVMTEPAVAAPVFPPPATTVRTALPLTVVTLRGATEKSGVIAF
jgi:hypothetical protein